MDGAREERGGGMSDQQRDALDMGACDFTFRVLHESLLAGGYSASRLVERLREVGIRNATVSMLHNSGLQDIANAIHDAAHIATERDAVDGLLAKLDGPDSTLTWVEIRRAIEAVRKSRET